MPKVPIDIPSDMVIVLNKTDFKLFASIESQTNPAKSLICILHGVTIDQVEATPTWGLLKSSSSNPAALNMDLEAACSGPSTKEEENFLFLSIIFF